MIDDKKIEEAANKHIETEYARYNSGEVEEEMICLRGKDSFKEGAKWAINEFIKDLKELIDSCFDKCKAPDIDFERLSTDELKQVYNIVKGKEK